MAKFASNSPEIRDNMFAATNFRTEGRTSVLGVCNYEYVSLSHLGNIVMRTETTPTTFVQFAEWNGTNTYLSVDS